MTSGTGPDTTPTDGGPPKAARAAHSPWLDLKTLSAILKFLWRATQGYRLRPWASPYLRWRIETYWGWHAEQIDARRFWAFTWDQRRELLRFLVWAGRMSSQQNHRLHS